MNKGTWQDPMGICEEHHAHLWTPASHAEWWNVYNLIGSSEWKYATEADTSHFMFLTTILFIEMEIMNQVSMWQ